MSAADATDRRRVAGAWLAFAEEDMRAAGFCLAGTPPALGAAAYHCQQAVEKSLKAALVMAGMRTGRTHDLDHLATDAIGAFPLLSESANACRGYSSWGVAFRYPIGSETGALPTRSDIDRALSAITHLHARVRALVDVP